MPPFPHLETPRLHLREIVASDVPALYAIHGNAERMKWFGVDPQPDQAAAANLVSMFASWREMPNPGTRWAIELKEQAGLIGTCGLFAWNRNWRKCTIGYELAQVVERNGYMREALVAVIAWGLQALELNRIEAQVHPLNTGSIKSVEKLGFKFEGRLRQLGYWAGQYHDMLQYSLLKQDWCVARAG